MFSHLFHMHENGQRMSTRQYRSDSDGNEVLVHAAEVEYYSFEQAGVHMVTVNDSTIKVRQKRMQCLQTLVVVSIAYDT